MESKLKDLYLQKPECVVRLPEWLLPPDRHDAYQAMSNLAIVEIAGRDSVAAAAKYCDEKSITDLLPTYVYTGTEHGAFSTINDAVKRLAERLPDVHVHDLVLLGSPGFWQALNGRFISELIARYGFYTPCVGCHVYLHSVRIPLAGLLGNIPILSGERELHDGSIKLNQLGGALDVYEKIAKEFKIALLHPIRDIAEGERIREILGFDWKEGKEQMGCVLSGNYRLLDSTVKTTEEQVQKYLEDFAWPCARRIVKAYMNGRIPNHLEVAAEVLEAKS